MVKGGNMATDVRIPPLRFFTQRVLPAVYTDELSYYEVLAKVVDKLNEIIDVVGDTATIEQIQQVIKDIEKELSALYVYVDKEVQGAKDYSDDQNCILENYLESLIVNATVGKVLVRSQTGGGICPLQEELDRQYDFLRILCLQCRQDGSFEKTAQEIDGYDATAYKFDLYNATLLDGNTDLPVQDGN